ncbi:hypothetical protein BH11MYX3_BH11MYX3_44280 [soil metagenome]
MVIAGCGDNLGVEDGPWGEATPLFPTAVADDDDPSLTADRLELYFNRDQDVYTAMRTTVASAWSAPVRVAELSTPGFETTPEVSGDGLTLYLASALPGDPDLDIYVATRASRGAAWSAPVIVEALSSKTVDGAAYVSEDGRTAVIGSDRAAGTDHDLFLSERASPDQPWPAPVQLEALRSPASDWSPALSADKLTLYFVSYRSGGGDLYISHRASLDAPFEPPALIDERTTPAAEADPWISPDGHHLVFTTDREHPGIESLYETSR